MFLISYQVILEIVSFLQSVAYCVETAVSGSLCGDGSSVKLRGYLSGNTAVFLLEMNFCDIQRRFYILKGLLK